LSELDHGISKRIRERVGAVLDRGTRLNVKFRDAVKACRVGFCKGIPLSLLRDDVNDARAFQSLDVP